MPTSLEGLEVFDDVLPNFSERPTLIGRHPIQIADLTAGTGRGEFFGKYPRHTLRHRYLFPQQSLDEDNGIHKILAFYRDRAGRHERFWVPSFMEEIQPASDAAGVNLSIEPIEYDATFLQATGEVTRLGNYIWLLDVDGTLEYRKVTSATTGDPEILTVSSAFSKTFTQGEFIAGFLYCVRFLADEIAIDWGDRNSAPIQLGFVETYDVTSEADA